MFASRIGRPSRANPSRDGDAKPGIFFGRQPGCREPSAGTHASNEVADVKSTITRFTMAVSLLATMALTLAAGLKWH